MWRKKGEANLQRLAGANDYDKQVPISRSIPLWGGLSDNGFAPILWHLDSKKTNKEKWSQEVRSGAFDDGAAIYKPKEEDGAMDNLV